MLGEGVMITCKDLVEFLVDYLDGTLEPETARALEEHLKDCQNCQAFLNTYKATLASLKELACEEMPAELRARLASFLKARIRREGGFRGSPSPPF